MWQLVAVWLRRWNGLLASCHRRLRYSTYNIEGFAGCAPPNNPPEGAAAGVCVLAPNAPPKSPPLAAGADGCAVEAPKRPPVAGAGVAGLFMPPKRPPAAGCAGVEPKRPPLLAG